MRTEIIPGPADFFRDHTIKGFLADDEGDLLHRYAAKAILPCLEVGSYCGRSTVYLGLACRTTGNTLYALDHHRGSEEHQLGELFHDSDLYNSQQQCMDSFPVFRNTLALAELEQTVVPLVASSDVVARHWATPLGMVFIDGGHSPEMSRQDCLLWCEKLATGGYLAIHDIFEHPEEGGQGPYLAMQAVLARGDFTVIDRVQSLVILERRGEPE